MKKNSQKLNYSAIPRNSQCLYLQQYSILAHISPIFMFLLFYFTLIFLKLQQLCSGTLIEWWELNQDSLTETQNEDWAQWVFILNCTLIGVSPLQQPLRHLLFGDHKGCVLGFMLKHPESHASNAVSSRGDCNSAQSDNQGTPLGWVWR